MPFTRLRQSLIQPNGSITGSLLGTASYAITSSYAMNGGSGGGSTPVVSVASLNNQTILYNFSSSQEATITGLTLTNNNWGINVVEEWNSASIVGDDYYNSCSLLLHCDGINGSTTFTDNSPAPRTVTATNGAAISTTQSKFGGASGFFDGTDDYLSIPTSNFNTFGTANFTVELFFRSNQNSRQYCSFISDEGGISTGLTILLNIASSSDGKIGVWQTGCVAGLTSTNGGYNDNNWHHIAYVRNGSIATIYVDGINQASTTVSGNPSTPAGAFIIGAAPGLSRYYNGYIDELRITNGIARYTGNFTPSTTQFLDSAGDANSSVVVNSTATGFAIGTGGINGAQLAKAWVNFNGTGTVAIRDSYNVSSITDLGVGEYTVNYNSFSNSNYCVQVSIREFAVYTASGANITNSSVKLSVYNISNTLSDATHVFVTIFSN